jgi:heme-degrading monooxygenase HmoA
VSVVEVTSFSLAAGSNEETFLQLDRRVQTDVVPNQPGFMRRTTARSGENWVVVTLWASLEHAAAFDEMAGTYAAQVEFDVHIEVGSVRTERYQTLD